MAETTFRGVVIPTAGDGLLTGLEEAFASAGIITQAASVAAARLALTAAVSGGAVITAARPMHFDIGGIIYRADGSQSGGVWVLRPVNEVETDEQTYTQAWSGTVTPEQFVPLMTSGLVTRPYDRVAHVFATMYGYTGSGAAHIAVTGNGSRIQLARLDTGSAQSVSVQMHVRIPAGQAPDIQAGPHGARTVSGSVIIDEDPRLNVLSVLAFPVTMAG